MSLINDALKQTKQARQSSPPSNPPPLSPVDSGSRGGGNWVVPVVMILLLGAGGIFIGLSLSKHTTPAANMSPGAMATTQQVETVAVAPTIATSPPSGSNTVTTVPLKPPPPKLQGILFAATRPCAIVSDKTVFVGDHVGEFRVTAIMKDSITLQSDTKSNVLSLNPQ